MQKRDWWKWTEGLYRRLLGDALPDVLRWAYTFVPASVSAAVTGWLAAIKSIPVDQAAIAVAAVFALVSFGSYWLRYSYLLHTQRGKLVYVRPEGLHLFVNDDDKLAIFQMKIYFYNSSHDQIWYRIDDLTFFIGYAGNPYAKPSEYMFIGSKCESSLVLPAVKDVPTNTGLDGHLKLHVSYGREKQSMDRTLKIILRGHGMVMSTDKGWSLPMNWIVEDVEYN